MLNMIVFDVEIVYKKNMEYTIDEKVLSIIFLYVQIIFLKFGILEIFN